MTVVDQWASGYRVAVATRHWVAGAAVTLHFSSPFDLQLLSSWGASATASRSGEATFALGEQPDPQYAGFGFTGRGAPPPEPSDVTCASVSAADIVKVSAASSECVLGARFEYIERWATGFARSTGWGSAWRAAGARWATPPAAERSATLSTGKFTR